MKTHKHHPGIQAAACSAFSVIQQSGFELILAAMRESPLLENVQCQASGVLSNLTFTIVDDTSTETTVNLCVNTLEAFPGRAKLSLYLCIAAYNFTRRPLYKSSLLADDTEVDLVYA